MSIRDWFNKTPTVSGPTKEEIRKATKRLEREKLITKTVYGGSHVERPPRTDRQQLPKMPNYNPNDMRYTMWNYSTPLPITTSDCIPPDWREIKDEIPVIDLIHKYKDELDNPYSTSIMVKDVLWMLDEIEKTLKEDL